MSAVLPDALRESPVPGFVLVFHRENLLAPSALPALCIEEPEAWLYFAAAGTSGGPPPPTSYLFVVDRLIRFNLAPTDFV
jgi:hypothetical protein